MTITLGPYKVLRVTFILVIDPGASTGLAFFENGEPLWHRTTKPPHAEVEEAIELLQQDHPTLEVVCEQGPTNHRRQAAACAPIEETVRTKAKIVHWVRPSEWKPHPAARLGKGDKPESRHESDVLRIGRWFLATRTKHLVHQS